MKVKQHRITIFLDDEEMKRVYNAVSKERLIPSKILRKALLEHLNKLEEENLSEESKTEGIVEYAESNII